jgi:nucleoside-diphosphate-sugar epimerase
MTTLVTGAAGLLGSHVVDVLSERGESVRALFRPVEKAAADPTNTTIEVCWGDLSDRASLERAVRGTDRVIHCAARTGPWGPPKEYEVANVGGLRSLVEIALDAGTRHFVHVSSITVHGNDVGGKADEASPLRLEPNPYSRSKLLGEALLQELVERHNAPVTIARPGWIYGPRDRASFARFAAQILRGRMIVVGSGRNYLPLIHARDVADGLVLASFCDSAIGRTYLLVNDEPVTQLEYLTAIAHELGVAPPRRHLPYRALLAAGALAEAVGHLTRRTAPPPLTRFGVQLLGGQNRFVIARARRELGFVPRVDLANGVRQSVDWFRREYC